MNSYNDNKIRLMAHNPWLVAMILIFISTTINAQQLESYSDKNYNDKVQTVLLHPVKDTLAKPVIPLNDMMGKLRLQFDIFSNDAPYMYYTRLRGDKPNILQTSIVNRLYLAYRQKMI